MIDLFTPGAYARTAGGNLERPDDQRPVIDWMAWSLNPDNGGGGGKAVWDECRRRWKQGGIADFPWLHVRTIPDLQRLISVAEGEDSPAIGLNIEDVFGDQLSLQGVGAHVLEHWVTRYEKPVHMATLPWVQNGQGWQHMAFAVAALEIFPDEQVGTFPNGYNPVVVAQCIGHAFAEGLEKVTLMLKTKPPQTRATYGAEFATCHSLYTADDITPSAEGWTAWKASTPCVRPKPPEVPVPPVLSPTQVPYTGPYYGPSDSRGPNKGPTAKALKRAMIRMGLFDGDLGSIDEQYNAKLEQALKRFQRQLEDVAATGQYGKATWEGIRAARVPPGKPNSGQYALDKLGQELVKKEHAADQVVDTPTTKVRTAIADFCLRAETVEARWTYTQRRPYTGLGVTPEQPHGNDCSSYVCLAYHWARQQSGVLVPDPAGYGFSGYGNTWDDLDGHGLVAGVYEVGDLAHYDGHVTICRKAGSFLSAVWSSFGREQGPEPTTLYYRDDLRFVCRPPLIP